VHFSELLAGLATVRAFEFQRAPQKQHRAQLDRSQRPFYLLFAVRRWLTLVLDLVVAGVAVLLAALVVALCGKLSAGYVGVALPNIILFRCSCRSGRSSRRILAASRALRRLLRRRCVRI